VQVLKTEAARREIELQREALVQKESVLTQRETSLEEKRVALDEAVASKEALREKAAMELGAAQRDAKDAEQRHVSHERRLLADVDRERVAGRQEARTAQTAARQALQAEKSAHREAAAWSREQQEIRVELATLRGCAAGAEQRAAGLTTEDWRLSSSRPPRHPNDGHAPSSARKSTQDSNQC